MKNRRNLLPSVGVTVISILMLGVLFAPHQIVRAETSTEVNSLADTISSDANCTLREAILTETGSLVAECGVGGTGLITFSVTGTINLTSQIAFTPTHALSIEGPTADDPTVLVVDAQNLSRIFDIDDTGNKGVTFKDMTLTNGEIASGQGGALLLESGSLTLDTVVVSSSSNDNGNGGGIYNAGTLTLQNSRLQSNRALRGAGVFNSADGTLIMNQSAFSGNQALQVSGIGGFGGGIYNDGQATLADSFMNGPIADINGGGIFNNGSLTLEYIYIFGAKASSGAAIYEDEDGSLTMESSRVAFNEATNGQGGGLFLSGSAYNQIHNSTINNNLNNDEEDDNRYGGGLYATDSVNLDLFNSTLTGNDASDAGGAVYWNSSGFLTLNNTTVVNNSDEDAAGGLVSNLGTIAVTNSIVLYNTSTNGNADCIGFGGSFDDLSYNLVSLSECDSWLTNSSSNVLTDAPQSAVLDETLANNGGPTLTLALVEGSPAIDAGYLEGAISPDCQETDQRGYERNGNCDIGAFEFEGIAPGSEEPGKHHGKSSGEEQPPVNLGGNCAALGGGSFTYNGSADVDCRLINADGVFKADAAEIGNLDVINRGVLQAVDLFRFDGSGHSLTTFDAPVTVCLKGSGQFLFINAANTPRTVEGPASYAQGGYTCAQIPNAGIAVLVPGDAAPAAAPTTSEAAPVAGETTLSNCTVTTLFRVNLHDGPSVNSPVIATIPFNVSYQATARTSDGWIKLIWSDTQGWARADLLTQDGTCGG